MRIAFVAIVIAIAFGLGWLTSQQTMPMAQSNDSSTSAEDSTQEEPLYWVAPMDPNYRRDKPGKSPMGMDLVPVYEEKNTGRDDGGVQINAAVRANLGVKTGAVSRGPVSIPVRTVGYVTDNEDELNHVHSRIAGWVEVLHVRSLGEKVSRGEPLYEIYSPELVNAQQEFLMSERLRRGSETTATGGKLRSFGMTDSQIANLKKTSKVRERITVFAPGSGYVAALPVRAGMYVRPDTEIMAIGSRDSVWVIAEFFERQAGLIVAGQPVVFTTPSMPDTQWQGTIDYVYPELDARTRTLRARVRVPNTDGRLRPNMFVNLTMDAPIGDDLLTIPRPALIQRSDSKHVLLAEEDGYFRPVPVKTGQEAGDRVVVAEGLEEGQQVVVSAQFLIDSETSLEAAMLRLEAEEQSSGDTESDSSPSELIEGVGRITELDNEGASITLEHAPIPELSWPAMTMAFDLAESVNMDALSPDQTVNFGFRETPEGYLVERIESAHDAQ
ncbi:efflux RND transporter periplasmic adaptor subunit [Marinobacter sp. NP-4(2019)]|uniref:efflux RND transporter periplasmic adaptor subunit n=1 Tax=Marinobacter sp. NP-4(2019) TaxID=2488665 RepID=UPI000FC3ED81|nr:efflux RND transporter periplasmic adaptor subunit [Marinobacter sp. NP-4(2019)]AZT82234.1 efflux RND transporter periplasmic adaptor subunit [Marinobacter sp. NP-4(2019)]